jgi:uncharacterized protein
VATTIGIISDTHGLIRPAALNGLTNVSLIIHAGDVGKQEVIDALNSVAPVLAIKGNIDSNSWADDLPTGFGSTPAAASLFYSRMGNE